MTLPRFVELCEKLRRSASATSAHYWAKFASRFSLSEVRQNHESRRFWPIPHQRSGRYPCPWAVRNCFAGINEEAGKDWAKHTTEKRLDLYGRPAEEQTAGNQNSRAGCAHSVRS